MKMKIPRLLHQIWLGDAAMHPLMLRWRQRWVELHPDWHLLTWSERLDSHGLSLVSEEGTVRPSPRKCDLLARACHLAQRSCIWRYLLVSTMGGLYLDTDVEPLRPLDDLVEGLDAFTARRLSTLYPIYECAFFGAVPGHSWAVELADQLSARDPAVSLSMGCDYFTEVTLRHPEVVVLPEREILFPVPQKDWTRARQLAQEPTEESTRALISAETRAVHHFSSMWYPRGFDPLARTP